MAQHAIAIAGLPGGGKSRMLNLVLTGESDFPLLSAMGARGVTRVPALVRAGAELAVYKARGQDDEERLECPAETDVRKWVLQLQREATANDDWWFVIEGPWRLPEGVMMVDLPGRETAPDKLAQPRALYDSLAAVAWLGYRHISPGEAWLALPYMGLATRSLVSIVQCADPGEMEQDRARVRHELQGMAANPEAGRWMSTPRERRLYFARLAAGLTSVAVPRDAPAARLPLGELTRWLGVPHEPSGREDGPLEPLLVSTEAFGTGSGKIDSPPTVPLVCAYSDESLERVTGLASTRPVYLTGVPDGVQLGEGVGLYTDKVERAYPMLWHCDGPLPDDFALLPRSLWAFRAASPAQLLATAEATALRAFQCLLVRALEHADFYECTARLPRRQREVVSRLRRHGVAAFRARAVVVLLDELAKVDTSPDSEESASEEDAFGEAAVKVDYAAAVEHIAGGLRACLAFCGAAVGEMSLEESLESFLPREKGRRTLTLGVAGVDSHAEPVVMPNCHCSRSADPPAKRRRI